MDKTDYGQMVQFEAKRVTRKCFIASMQGFFFLFHIFTQEHAEGITKMRLEDVTVLNFSY